MSHLAEVAEGDAGGTVAELYADIRRVLGVPVVNLVYRHLAVEPERLAAVWGALRPNLASAAGQAAARGLAAAAAPPAVEPITAEALAAAGLGAERARLARATLDAYARANSRNLLGMQALLDGCAGTGVGGDAAGAPAGPVILPMARLETFDAPVRALLDEMAAALVGGGPPLLVPSLLRHFAAAELMLLWGALGPVVEELAERRTSVLEAARGLAAALPHPVERLGPGEARDVAARFRVAMASLLLAGEAIRLAISNTRE